MADIAELGIKVLSDDVVKATKRLDKLEDQSKQSEKQNKSLGKSFGLLKGAIAAVGIGALAKGVISTAASFEKLEASLITVTGSTEKATQAMQGITDFATSTPFQVEEITDAFIKLKSLGIAPTEENLRSFGNTASAMGKSLNQFIEAVADAATNEFERLKEFGIKARQQGDNVSFTFQGVTTTVKKNSEEITGYLESIGQTQFAGAMEKQMDTLDGAFSNLSDTISLATKKLAEESGFSNAVKGATHHIALMIRQMAGTETIDDFNNEIEKTERIIEKLEKQLIVTKEEGADFITRFFGGDNSSTVKVATAQIDSYKKRLAELQSQVKEAKEKSDGGITAAGASKKDPLAEREELLDKEFELASNHSDRMLRLIEMEDEAKAMEAEKLEESLAVNEDYYSRLYNLQAGSLRAGADFAKSIRDSDLKGAIKTGALMLSNSAKQNKQAFEVQKAFALANAVVTLPSAVMKSFDNGGGYPWGLIPAGLMLATGLQQINSIRSASFGGGGSVPSASAGGGSTSPSAPVASGLPEGSTAVPNRSEQPTSREIRVTVEGDGANSEMMRNFIKDLEETASDMGSDTRLVLS